MGMKALLRSVDYGPVSNLVRIAECSVRKTDECTTHGEEMYLVTQRGQMIELGNIMPTYIAILQI